MRLWLKIFLWFWLAMAFVAAVLALSIYLTSPSLPMGRPGPPVARRWQRLSARVVQGEAVNAARLFEAQGAQSVSRRLAQLEEETGVMAALYDDRGRHLAGEEFSSAGSIVNEAITSQRLAFGGSPGSRLVARGVTSASGKSYALVGWVPRPGPWQWEFSDLAIRLAAVLLTGGVLCYLLARYLTGPASDLQKTVRRLAAGELEARVGQSVRSRNDELGDLARDFDYMATRLQELLESQNILLRDISHELRSPLARLNVALELARAKSPPEAGPALERIELESSRMNQLIGQILELARLEGRTDPVALEPVQLDRVVREVVADAQFEAQSLQRNILLSECPPCSVKGHRELLRRAVENVIRNALRHAPEATAVEVSLTLRPEDEPTLARLRIRDHGPGIPEADRERIFHPFYRTGEARDRQSGGAGLGLAITQKICSFHQGQAQARNAHPGLEVEIRLPVTD